MRTHDDGTPGNFAVVAASNPYGGIGHMQVGIILPLLGGENGIAAANVVVLAFPNLILTCVFPLAGIKCRYRCDLSLYCPLWPRSAAWRPMHRITPALSPDEDALGILEALAEKVEVFHELCE